MKIKELSEGTIPEANGKGLPVRVVWSRGKKEAKTQYRYLSNSVAQQKFEEKIQINTILNLDPETGMPTQQKMSRLAVTLNRNYQYAELAEVQFDMANFKQGRYNKMRLPLVQSAANETYTIEAGSFLEIGIKGTRADGLIK